MQFMTKPGEASMPARVEHHRPGGRITAPRPAANRDAEASPRKPLAVGLLIDSLKTPAWVARVVREVQAGDYAEIAAVIVNRTHDAPLGERAGFNGLLFGVFRLLDRLMSGAFDNPFKRIDIATDVQSAETIAAAPRISGATVRFDDADLARIRRLKLDVLLCFGFPTLRGGILDAAEYGAWSYRHGQDGARGGSHGLFWDMYDRNTVSSVVLRIDGPSPRGGRVIYRSVAAYVRGRIPERAEPLLEVRPLCSQAPATPF